MPRKRIASRLLLSSVREVQTALVGDHSGGGGLVLRVGRTSATWVLRFTAPTGKLRRKLRQMGKGCDSEHYAALPCSKVPAFVAQLRLREGIAARALEFGVLTAARTGEIVGERWEDFDVQARTWTVAASRMKAGEEHFVHLSARAVEIIGTMCCLGQPYVFPSPLLDGRPLSNMAMLTLLRRMDADKTTTVHGLCRSTFSTWANAAEHKVLLSAWAEYLEGKAPASNVVSLRQERSAQLMTA
jgi:hypothetical protein